MLVWGAGVIGDVDDTTDRKIEEMINRIYSGTCTGVTKKKKENKSYIKRTLPYLSVRTLV